MAVVTIAEAAGMSLSLSPDPDLPGVLVAWLRGTAFEAAVSVDPDAEPAFPGMGQLGDFLISAAGVAAGRERQWTASGEDFTLRAEAGDDGRVLLGVYMGSTSDDACCWQTDATLSVVRAELRRAGAALAEWSQAES
ncbi:hypothetical protein GobsT_63890 [Gemmata obscuriglobus]|uniref:Uncharacterized protein n=1 Tax=Gemmata obscuriglobus TaxID=114 RepID=A0A2Z3H4F9_9BACT|nr:hypothetical protein [Gemmata obscuriglobus]AWM35880.1 hypothetical protein C1280_01860 [Gemmata obscuriglobus]QEG28933.1 hypothetical protein GobsT_37220 [Gemmata obscuriglobus]QEG29630.1 hypothetical protein GobsT_44280 [Gemmata obscuriglobus]QEG31567.1 hypothetical protein GobsT_63890 [Gemmata obscuriglobus]VTS07441.1 Uncharacterized protein OS=Pseudomonas fluorescens (strain Pf-5 / ATCC BAA-477) GN=PFL_2808 PE=4 SV=1 [Gemmata obscuriglobus UQM 2246]